MVSPIMFIDWDRSRSKISWTLRDHPLLGLGLGLGLGFGFGFGFVIGFGLGLGLGLGYP